MGAFYVAVLPQFIPAGTGHFTMGLLLTAVHILIGLLWSAVFIGFARTLRGLLRKPHARRLLDRITGTVIGGLRYQAGTQQLTIRRCGSGHQLPAGLRTRIRDSTVHRRSSAYDGAAERNLGIDRDAPRPRCLPVIR
ncbi:LysE family translocator [Streptomyces sp. NPDC055089]